jgi:hypothetical protein
MTDPPGRLRCDAVTADGSPCRGTRRPGLRFCFFHDPATAREREAAQARSVANARASFARRREKLTGARK